MGEIVGELHMKRIRQTDVAAEMGISSQFLSAVLNGAKHSSGIEGRIRNAIARIEARRKEESADGA